MKVTTDADKTLTEYVKPSIVDYGSLEELTEASVNGSVTDVPQGSPCCAVFS
jgi:hypothetical protein